MSVRPIAFAVLAPRAWRPSLPPEISEGLSFGSPTVQTPRMIADGWIRAEWLPAPRLRACGQADLEAVRSLGEMWRAAAELSGLLLEDEWPLPCPPVTAPAPAAQRRHP